MAADLGEQEHERLGTQVRAGEHDIGLGLPVGVVDDDRPTGGQLGGGLLHPGHPAQLPGPGQGGERPARHQVRRRVQLAGRLHEQVGLQVDPVVDLDRPESGLPQGDRDEGHREAVLEDLGRGQAHSVDGDGALGHHLVHEPPRWTDPDPAAAGGVLVDGGDLADRVGVSLDQMPVQGVTDPKRQFEVDAGTRRRSARVLRRAVSSDTSAANQSSPISTADRQAPLTHTEPPTARLPAVLGALTTSRRPASTRVPTSLIRPLNMTVLQFAQARRRSAIVGGLSPMVPGLHRVVPPAAKLADCHRTARTRTVCLHFRPNRPSLHSEG